MNFAKFWAKESSKAIGADGGEIRTSARGWSDESLEDARRAAKERAAQVARRIASGAAVREYGYGRGRIPEPVLRELPGTSGQTAAVITRNSYGALILNAESLMFIDIDGEEPKPAAPANLRSGLLSLFGKSPQPVPAPQPLLARISQTSETTGEKLRAYQTAAGYRLIVVSRGFEAGSPQSEELLERFGSDPLYRRLCRQQKCFRARLTPKPWRCGMRPPAVTFPYSTPQDEYRMRSWESRYEATIVNFATCKFIGEFGSGWSDPSFASLVDLHDSETKATSSLPLA